MKDHTPADLKKFVSRYPGAHVDGFFWCEGHEYRVVVLAKFKTRTMATEFSATSPTGLIRTARAHHIRLGDVKKVRKLCRSAPRSRRGWTG